MELIVIQLTIAAVFGGVTAAIANSKGRSPVGWFFVGFFTGLIGMIIICVMSNLHEERRRQQAIERENRRLREQLVQEQIKTEALRQHTVARLDAHDQTLGIDTRSTSPILPGSVLTPLLPGQDVPQALSADAWLTEISGTPASSNGHADWPVAAQSPAPVQDVFYSPEIVREQPLQVPQPPREQMQAATPTRQWYYEEHGETRGPLTDKQLVEMARSGQIVADTLVWTEQLGDWKAAGTITPLKPYLATT